MILPSDPYSEIPNLSGVRSGQLEESRAGDPSRFFEPLTGAQMNSITTRILDVPRVSVCLTAAAQAIVTGTPTAIIFDTEMWDPRGMWDPAFPTRLTAKASGVYVFKHFITWQASITGFRETYIRRTTPAAVKNWGYYVENEAGGATPAYSTTPDIDMNAGDYVEAIVNQTCGVNLNYIAATAADQFNAFQGRLVSTFGSETQ